MAPNARRPISPTMPIAMILWVKRGDKLVIIFDQGPVAVGESWTRFPNLAFSLADWARNKARSVPVVNLTKEPAMRFPRALVLAAACVTLLPAGTALGQGAGSGGGQGGAGPSAGSSGAAVGGGPPAGAVG